MAESPRILAMVMAGGEGKRLHPLTAHRSKPAVPFGGRYRIVDFVLSNLVNSQVVSIYLLVQYKSQSLIEHVRRAWSLGSLTSGHFVTVVPPQMRTGTSWFQGTADAVYQNLNLIEEHAPGLVAVFGADHIYRMDLRQMAAFHRERGADVSVAALPVPVAQAGAFGILGTDPDGRIRRFQEKPVRPEPMPGDPARAYASMGNYLFNADFLVRALEEAHARGEDDFGKHLLPHLAEDHRVFAYDFATNEIPGIKPYEEPAYWRDVGTIESYFDAHKDVLGRAPRFEAFNPEWPIRSSSYQGPVAKIIGGEIDHCILGAGTVIDGARLQGSVVRREVAVERDSELEECIVMDYVHIPPGCRLRRCIIDRYNRLEPGTTIGYDPEADAERYFVSPSGIAVARAGRRTLDEVY